MNRETIIKKLFSTCFGENLTCVQSVSFRESRSRRGNASGLSFL